MNMNDTQHITAKPSLSRAAMLVDLSFSQWTGRKKDKTTSDEVVAAKHAKSKKAASVYNALLGDCKELEDISKFVSKARVNHMRLTLPWNDTGTRLLPVKATMEYAQFISDTQNEFERLVKVFLARYPQLRHMAAFELGDLFDADNYPDVSALESKFALRCEYTPVPSCGDFRLDVDTEVMEEMRVQYEEVLARRMAQATQDMWERLHKQLKQMADRLGTEDGTPTGKPNVFRDSLVENAKELVGLLDMLNPAGDKALDEAKRDLMNALNGVDPETLRQAPTVRQSTLSKINEMLDKYDFGTL